MIQLMKDILSKLVICIKQFVKKHHLLYSIISYLLHKKRYFIIITYAYNCQDTIEECLKSIYEQKYDRLFFKQLIIDDASTDATSQLVQKWIYLHQDQTFLYKRNETHTGRLKSLKQYIQDIHPCIIVVELDGDRKLSHPKVLYQLNQQYLDLEKWLVYSNLNNEVIPSNLELLRNILKNQINVHDLFITYRAELMYYLKEEMFYIDPQEEILWEHDCQEAYIIPLFELAGTHTQRLTNASVKCTNVSKKTILKNYEAIYLRNSCMPLKSLQGDIAYINQHPLLTKFVKQIMQYVNINITMVPLNYYYHQYRKVIIPNGFHPKYQTTIARIPPHKRIYIEVAFFPQLKNVYFDLKGIHGYSSIRNAKLPELTVEQVKELEDFRQFYTGRNFTKIGESFREYSPDEGEKKYDFPFIFVPLQMENDTAYDLCPFENNQEIVSFIEECFPDWVIIFKNHPNWPSEYNIRQGNILLPVDNRDLRILMIKAKYVVSINSTVLLEALMHKKICASLGEGFSTNHNVCLECHKDRSRLKKLIGWSPDWNKVDRFLYYLLQKQIRIDFWKSDSEIKKLEHHLKDIGLI
ncbi:MAG: glycosyltransferase [Candidatus Auribacterota bacterium]|nr:glycosyltransferase [Candidatus Auribacterota bacterium]